MNVDLADSAFAAFRRMCIVAKEKGIDLQMFLSPLHHNFVLKEEQRSAWLQRLNTIAQQCGFRIRRFSEAELKLRSDGTFLDATHFHPNTGDRILRALFAVNRGASRSGSER